jgi:hypothetical protein
MTSVQRRSSKRRIAGLQLQPNRKSGLRRQPKLKKLYAATTIPMPHQAVPKTAQERRRRQRRARWQVPTASLRQIVTSARWLSIGLLAVCLYAVMMIGRDEQFYLTSIPVEGTLAISPAEIVAASGMAGAHSFAVNPGEAAAAINAVPGVISATVTLTWPNQASIRIVEDTPRLVWEHLGETYWLTNSGAVVPARGEAPGLPLIHAEAYTRSAKEAEKIRDEEEAAEDVALPFIPEEAVEGVVQLQTLLPQVREYRYRPDGGLSFVDAGGWRVYLGVGNDMHQKLAVYNALVAALQDEGQTPVYISVSNQQKPFYQLAGR